jgi:hypothetical protein
MHFYQEEPMRLPFPSLVTLVTFCLLAVLPAARAADWKEPLDGLFTEKQVENYAAAQKDVLQLLKAMGKATEGGKGGAAALNLMAGLDDKVTAILAKHDLQRKEFDWLGGKVLECWGVGMMDDMLDGSKAELAQQKKKNAAEIESAKARIAEYEKARKSGTRVMTKEQRDAAVQSAKEAQDAASEEARQHADDAKAAADEGAKYEADAKAADALAKNPPADVEADARADYIKGTTPRRPSPTTTKQPSRRRTKPRSPPPRVTWRRSSRRTGCSRIPTANGKNSGTKRTRALRKRTSPS